MQSTRAGFWSAREVHSVNFGTLFDFHNFVEIFVEKEITISAN